MPLKIHIVVTFIFLIICIIFFSFSMIDFFIQDYFFDFRTQQWLLEKNEEPYRFIFYSGVKKLLILVGILCIVAFFLGRKNKTISSYKQGLLIVILSAIFVPLITVGIKKNTLIPCPKNEVAYGGVYPHKPIWQSHNKVENLEPVHCWPAGHASGGFALLSLVFLFKSKKNKLLAVALALGLGWSMGLYKMLIGDHFFSHTFISMVLAWLIILIIAFMLRYKKENMHA